MYYFKDKNWAFIVKRHGILIFLDIFKFIFSLLFIFFLYWFYFRYKSVFIWDLNFIRILFFIFIFIILNYIFFKYILSLIEYYNNLIVIHDNKISIIKCSLILKDDVEAINPLKIMKIDVFSHWLISNILNFWNLVIEQQKDEVRIFHFIPRPERLLQIIRDMRAKEESKK